MCEVTRIISLKLPDFALVAGWGLHPIWDIGLLRPSVYNYTMSGAYFKFGPKVPEGMEENWIKTIPGQGFFAMFRLGGPVEPGRDGTWKLNDIDRVK